MQQEGINAKEEAFGNLHPPKNKGIRPSISGSNRSLLWMYEIHQIPLTGIPHEIRWASGFCQVDKRLDVYVGMQEVLKRWAPWRDRRFYWAFASVGWFLRLAVLGLAYKGSHKEMNALFFFFVSGGSPHLAHTHTHP